MNPDEGGDNANEKNSRSKRKKGQVRYPKRRRHSILDVPSPYGGPNNDKQVRAPATSRTAPAVAAAAAAAAAVSPPHPPLETTSLHNFEKELPLLDRPLRCLSEEDFAKLSPEQRHRIRCAVHARAEVPFSSATQHAVRELHRPLKYHKNHRTSLLEASMSPGPADTSVAPSPTTTAHHGKSGGGGTSPASATASVSTAQLHSPLYPAPAGQWASDVAVRNATPSALQYDALRGDAAVAKSSPKYSFAAPAFSSPSSPPQQPQSPGRAVKLAPIPPSSPRSNPAAAAAGAVVPKSTMPGFSMASRHEPPRDANPAPGTYGVFIDAAAGPVPPRKPANNAAAAGGASPMRNGATAEWGAHGEDDAAAERKKQREQATHAEATRIRAAAADTDKGARTPRKGGAAVNKQQQRADQAPRSIGRAAAAKMRQEVAAAARAAAQDLRRAIIADAQARKALEEAQARKCADDEESKRKNKDALRRAAAMALLCARSLQRARRRAAAARFEGLPPCIPDHLVLPTDPGLICDLFDLVREFRDEDDGLTEEELQQAVDLLFPGHQSQLVAARAFALETRKKSAAQEQRGAQLPPLSTAFELRTALDFVVYATNLQPRFENAGVVSRSEFEACSAEFDAVTSGWETLCAFLRRELGADVPEDSVPFDLFCYFLAATSSASSMKSKSKSRSSRRSSNKASRRSSHKSSNKSSRKSSMWASWNAA